MHVPKRPKGSRVVGVACCTVLCMCWRVRAWSIGICSPSSRWRRSSVNSAGLASSGRPSAQNTVLPGRWYCTYSRSSLPYRKAGSARTCGGIAMLMRGAPVGMSCVVIVGVIRLTGTSWCLLVAGLEAAGVRGLGGAWMMRPRGSGVLWPLWVCGRGYGGGSVDGGGG